MNTLGNPPDLLLDSVLQTSLDGIVLCRAIRNADGEVVDFRVIRCNDRAVRMVGVSRETILAHSMLSVDPEGHSSGIFQTYRHVVDTGLPMHIEHYFAGARIWMAQSLARLGDDEVLASWADITPQKQAERDRRHQTELLQAILDNTDSGIAVMESVRDASGSVVDFRFTHLNPDAERITQRTKDTLVGELYTTAWPEARTNGVLDWHLRVATTGTPIRVNGVNLPAGGYNGWYNVRIRPFGDGVIATFVDVTALKQQQQQLEQANRDLLNANDNLRQFAYVASHDLQEPLRKIQSFGDLLQNQFGTVLGEAGQDIIGRMQSATGRMSTLIKDVLAYSRISTHREPFRAVCLSELLTDVCQELKAEYREAGGQAITVDPLPVVPGDRNQLHHLFSNLLANALKFRSTNQPVAVRVMCRSVPGADGPPTLDSTTVYHEISLTDNGIGFDNTYADRMFQVFQRLHSRQQYAGTGIGLAICKRVVENHRGAITAAGQPGEGATFRVYLPQ